MNSIDVFIKHLPLHLRKSFPARAEVPRLLDVGCVKLLPCGKDYGNAKGATGVL